MGRAMVRKPKVFLFDEPLSNLDAKLRVQMRSEIKQNHARLKTTTVYVTHDQIEAMTMADRIVVMQGGRVEQIGTPLDLYDAPANLFVAGFIGSPGMNLLPGRVEGGAFAGADGVRLALPAGHGAAEGSAVTLGIRPEHLTLDPDGFAATILTVEPTGSETQAVMAFAGQDIVGAFRQRIRQQPGAALRLGIDPARVHLFDTASGARINGPAASETN
jgi:multiple sugar transport system ATP-binding protein